MKRASPPPDSGTNPGNRRASRSPCRKHAIGGSRRCRRSSTRARGWMESRGGHRPRGVRRRSGYPHHRDPWLGSEHDNQPVASRSHGLKSAASCAQASRTSSFWICPSPLMSFPSIGPGYPHIRRSGEPYQALGIRRSTDSLVGVGGTEAPRVARHGPIASTRSEARGGGRSAARSNSTDRRNNLRRHGLLIETIRDWIPSRFQVPFRYRRRLRRFPMTFEDSDMLPASQRRSILRPSR